MRIGRPPLREAHVDALEGTELEKERLKAILLTLSGKVPVEEACQQLGLRRSRFNELRKEALQAALDGLVPGVPGRPPKATLVDAGVVSDLERELGWLREELELSRVRTEIALVMPEILREPVSEPPGKSPARARRKRARSGARKRGTRRDSKS